jgi:hypothetical protein
LEVGEGNRKTCPHDPTFDCLSAAALVTSSAIKGWVRVRVRVRVCFFGAVTVRDDFVRRRQP